MPIVAVQRFKAKGLEPFRALSTDPDKVTNNGYDYSWGYGIRVGWLGQLTDRLAAGVSAGRTDEEIQIVFDRYKAALYRLYNRELRRDPTLRGQMVLRLTIEPDGSVSMCELHSSSMEAPELAGQVVERVRSFDFGAKEDIVAITIIYPIDFLPAA